MKPMKLTLLSLCFASATLSMAQNPADYRPAVYPQQQTTVGTAVLTTNETDGTYTFSNGVLSASFVKKGDKLSFGGCEAMNLKASDDLFTLKFGEGGSTVLTSSEMTLTDVHTEELTGAMDAVKGAEHFSGKALVATFTTTVGESNVTVTWRAELRDGSHYLRTDVTLKADKDTKMFAVIPMQYVYDVTAAGSTPVKAGNTTHGALLMNDKIFCGLETPMGKNSVESVNSDENPTMDPFTWKVADFTWRPKVLPAGLAAEGLVLTDLVGKQGLVKFDKTGDQTVTFQWSGGNLRLDVAGVDIVDPETGNVVSSSFKLAYTGGGKEKLNYTINVPEAGKVYLLRYYVDLKADGYKLLTNGESTGNVTFTCGVENFIVENTAEEVLLQGLWSRNTTLLATEPWNVSSVIGLIGQTDSQRRSFLAYSERERAVPWRCFPHYNCWYELGINRNNANPPEGNMNVGQTVEVMKEWKKNLFDKYGVGIQAYLWDDGWDDYKEWGFHGGFPNGFDEPDAIARQMCSGEGTWLGPVGGYGESGRLRRQYWSDKGGLQLSNPRYFKAFTDATSNLVRNYDFRIFKFDGISTAGTAYGPSPNNTTGEENAEGIIRVERYIRDNIREDIFFNTTVGTWASPFWFHFADAIWRQDADYNEVGKSTNNTRENWITYRDHMVYDIYHTPVPVCPINTLMTHGVIFTEQPRGSMKPGGAPDGKGHDFSYSHMLNEMRCAFACGSGMVELYLDSKVMNQVEGGKLWGDLAELIKWQRNNADVLPDAHWVGGNPWDGTNYNIYGWASWNGIKATLALRNGDEVAKDYTFTLRDALDIPSDVKTTVTLTKSFESQLALAGLTEDAAIDVDAPITVTIPGNSIYVFDGMNDNAALVPVETLEFKTESVTVAAGSAVAPQYTVAPLNASNKTLSWSSADEDIATVNDGAITGVTEGETTVTATALDGSGKKATIKVVVAKSMQNDLNKLIEEAQAAYDANEAVTYSDNLIKRNDQFSANFTETSEGSINDLLDGNASTFWHSTWKGVSGNTMDQHYLQVALDEPIDGNIVATQVCRSDAKNDFVKACRIDGSNDGTNFTENVSRATWSDVVQSTAPGKTFKSTFNLEAPYKYLRFWISETTNNRVYGHFAEFQLNHVDRESVNSTHKAEADALLAALTEARKVKEATQEDIDVLDAAYKAYLSAVNPTVGITSAQVSTADSRIFDLQGRAVNVATKGVFIVNGKKVIR